MFAMNLLSWLVQFSLGKVVFVQIYHRVQTNMLHSKSLSIDFSGFFFSL